MRILKQTLLFFLVLGWSNLALSSPSAEPTKLLINGQPSINIGPLVQHLEVPNQKLTYQQVLERYHEGRFTQSTQKTPSFGFTSSEYWFVLEIKTSSADHQERLLQIAYAPLDHIEVFLVTQGKLIIHETMGDTQPFADRPLPNRNFVVPLNFRPGQKHTLLVKAQQFDGDVVEVPMQLLQSSAFTQSEIKVSLFDGAFIGIMLIMAIYNLFLFTYLRDKAYLAYVVYVLFASAFVAAIEGWAFQHIWPDSIIFQKYCFPIFIAVMGISIVELTKYLLEIKPNQRANNSLNILKSVIILVLASCFFTPYWLGYGSLLLPVIILGALVLFTQGLQKVHEGSEPACYFCVAFFCLFTGAIITITSKQGWVPNNTITSHAFAIGSILEVCLFSLALASRIRALKESNIQHLKDLATEHQLAASANQKLVESSYAKMFIFSDLAHRVNNPLNIANGGVYEAQRNLETFTNTVLALLPEASERNEEENKVAKQLTLQAKEAQLSILDTKAQLRRAINYLSDLRVMGELKQGSPEPVQVSKVLTRVMERLVEDKGQDIQNNIKLPQNTATMTAAGHPAILATSITTWLQHALDAAHSDDVVELSVKQEPSGHYIYFKASSSNNDIFQKNANNNSHAKDIVLGLLGSQGAQWHEELNPQGSIHCFQLRLPATAHGWTQGVGTEVAL